MVRCHDLAAGIREPPFQSESGRFSMAKVKHVQYEELWKLLGHFRFKIIMDLISWSKAGQAIVG